MQNYTIFCPCLPTNLPLLVRCKLQGLWHSLSPQGQPGTRPACFSFSRSPSHVSRQSTRPCSDLLFPASISLNSTDSHCISTQNTSAQSFLIPTAFISNLYVWTRFYRCDTFLCTMFNLDQVMHPRASLGHIVALESVLSTFRPLP